MAIQKAKVDKDYVVIPNQLARDERLTFEARGVLIMLLSLPDDWVVSKEWVISQSTAGRDRVNRIFRELQELGYARKHQARTAQGRLDGVDWLIFPYSNKTELLKTRTTDSPQCGKPDTTKERSKQSKDNTNISVITDAFDFFWNAYPVKRRKNKTGCFNKFKSKCKGLGQSDIEKLTNKIVKDVKQRLSDVDDIKYIPMTEPYINQERWMDYE